MRGLLRALLTVLALAATARARSVALHAGFAGSDCAGEFSYLALAEAECSGPQDDTTCSAAGSASSGNSSVKLTGVSSQRTGCFDIPEDESIDEYLTTIDSRKISEFVLVYEYQAECGGNITKIALVRTSEKCGAVVPGRRYTCGETGTVCAKEDCGGTCTEVTTGACFDLGGGALARITCFSSEGAELVADDDAAAKTSAADAFPRVSSRVLLVALLAVITVL